MSQKTHPDHSIHNSELSPGAGLSKREYFSLIALQGILASGLYNHYEYQDPAGKAVQYADQLIDKLNKEE